MKIMKRPGVLAKKIGMTSIYTETGRVVPVTLLEMKDASVVFARCLEKEDGSSIWEVQVGSGHVKNITRPLEKRFQKLGVPPKKILKSFFVDQPMSEGVFCESSDRFLGGEEEVEKNPSLDEVACESQKNQEKVPTHWASGHRFSVEYFKEGAYVDVTGITLGKGFAGPMKRHNFGGLRASHGVSISHRSGGSIGNRKFPGRVFKGKKMAGHLGCERVTIQNLCVMGMDQERSLIIVKGSVPGFESGWVVVKDAVKKQ